MIRLLLLGCLWLFAGSICHGQNLDCSNIGFEEESFRGWERRIGIAADTAGKLIYINMRPGTVHLGSGTIGHVITSISDGYDSRVTEKIPVVAPGSQHSVRLGTSVIGSTTDQLRATLLVSPESPLLMYKFAIVLQNPHHKPYQQPAFLILVRTMGGDTISCGYYEAAATNQTAGFSHEPNTDIIYRNWTTSILDLRNYIGQQLMLEVTAHGCADGGHFGYAYFDAQCLEAAITPSSFCSTQDTTMRLAAPDGFNQYRWSTGDTTATINIKPRVGDKYTVNVQAQSTLRPDCSTQLDLAYEVNELIVPKTTYVTLCAGESYQVGDSVYTRSGTYRTVIHRPLQCDSILLTRLSVQPAVGSSQSLTLCAGSQLTVGDSSYRSPGDYQTRIRRAAPLCDSLVTTHLEMNQVELDPIRDAVVMAGDSIQLKAPAPVGAIYQYSWSPPEELSCPSCATTWAKPTQTTRYQVTASIPGLSSCEASQSINVKVVPCPLGIPNAFTPNGDGVNDTFGVFAIPCLGRIRQMSVFNRWGQVVFHQEPAATAWPVWDGTFQGESSEAGVYVYQLTIESNTGKINHYSGSITLLR